MHMIGYCGTLLCGAVTALAFIQFFLFAGRYSFNRFRPIFFLEICKTCILLCAILLLIVGFIISDFTLVSVYTNSHTLQPLIFRISASWAHHEGSMLLWILVMQFYSIAFAKFSKMHDVIKNATLNIHNILILLFLVYLLLCSNPFATLDIEASNGLGMNPILQDSFVAIHPVKLYFGYVGTTILFSLSCGILMSNVAMSGKLLMQMRPWILITWSLLTSGIALGSYWAYRELGWGGFWFWDPVENISLMPWLLLTTMIHVSLPNFGKNISEIKYKMIIKIGIFVGISAVFGMLMVRSGLLSSVHSFAENRDRSLLMSAICMFMILLSTTLYCLKKNALIGSEDKSTHNIGENLIVFMIFGLNYAFLMMIIILIIGILAPVVSLYIFSVPLSIGVNFYNNTCGAIMLIVLIFCIVAMLAKQSIKYLSAIICAILLLSSCITWFMCIITFAQTSMSIDTIFSITLIVISLSMGLVTIFVGFGSKINIAPMILAHFGIAVMLIGIVFASRFGREISTVLRIGEMREIFGFTILCKDLEYVGVANYFARTANIIVQRDGRTLGHARPETRFYPIEKAFTSDVDTVRVGPSDIYIAIGKMLKDEKDATVIEVKIFYKPMIAFIWLGAALIYISGLYAILLQIAIKQRQ